jgi:cysteine-rich repeat protein
VLSATDAEGNAVTYAVGNASNGTLGAVTGNKVTFTPTAAGAASFTFTATDGTGTGAPATVTVNALASAKSCLEMRRAGVVASGVYKVDADGDGDEPTLDVYCDQVYDGGGWLRLVNHDIAAGGYFPSKVAAESSNEGDPTSPLHSILGHLEGFRTNGGFEFRLGWPAKHALRNIWMQTSNPLAGSVEGYRGVRTDTRSVYWGGLEKSQSALTLLDGSVFVTDFWYAVGEISAYGKGLPAAPGVSDDGSVRAVQLWVRPVPTCGDGFVDDLETCDDGNMKDGDGCNASCQVEATAFHSCREILAGGQSKGDGTYIIKPTDSSADTLAVYCDMTRDGGGWTMIGKASAGNYTHLTQDEYVALIMNANDHVTPTTLLDPTYPPYRTMAFLNRPTTNALGASSGHTVRIDYESETVPGATGIFFQKRLNVPNDWDLWGAIRDARLWNNDGTVTGDHVANFGTDFITGYSYDPVTEAVSNIGGGVLGCWPTSPGLTTYALNDGTNFEPCRHGGLIGDGFHSGNAWLFTANASDGRFRNDKSSRQRSRIWLR